jgi:hypothetical protein
MTLNLIEFALLLSLLHGLLVWVAVLLWHSQSPIPRFLLFILFGLLAVVCMLGLVGLGNLLACWLTIYC